MPNRKAVEWTILLGLALGCEIAEHAVFHRKNYFYPDNPKGYQISQYDEPLCVERPLRRCPAPTATREVGIVRAHLEEDAAKTIHVGGAEGRIHGAEQLARRLQPRRHAARRDRDASRTSARPSEAKRFLQLLRQTVVELGISDAEMEKGSLRFDVNVSVRPEGSDELRTRTELKNMNSFNFAAQGIEREIGGRSRSTSRAARSSRRRCTSTRATSRRRRCARRRRRRTTATSRSPTSCRSSPTAELVERLRGELPELPCGADPAARGARSASRSRKGS